MVNPETPLEVRDLNFSYGNNPVLRDVSFTMGAGVLLGLLGPNGAGKSTLFRCILGLEKSHTGTVFLDGRDIQTLNPAALAKRIAYVPQTHAPSFNYSALDMVLMGTAAQGKEWAIPNTRQRATADEALERMGMSKFRDRGFRQLSGGEQQLILIARALAQDARLLVMDEPTANLDYGNQIRVLLQIQELSRQGYSIIISTHNPDHAFLFTDQVLALHNNQIAASGPPGDVLTAELITRLYGVQVTIRRDDRGVPSCLPVISHG
ncbi:ABC transporter ATP-binding protein [Treponema primitia]|uniref:ABC transporter ATP-binding protein n=1 Tax=Treponema primitia TaxID=88058 RepID=UPI0002555128|nr:ABC transporter ATP-binding protein [Treponema primitia]